MGAENSTSFYLDPPKLIGRPNADGTISITPLELKRLNDFNYAVAKMIQGGLNLANLNKEANQVFTDMNGNITEISETASGLSVSVSNLSGDVSTISATVNGLSVADETGSYTIIDGDKIVSKDHATSGIVEIKDGKISIKNGTTLLGQILPSSTLGVFIEAGTGKYIYLSGDVQVGMYDSVAINGSTISATSDSTIILVAGTNMSLNADGTVYIGTNASHSGNVDIGRAGGTVHLVGDVYINGVLHT